MMLQDPTFFESVHRKLEQELLNVEWFLYQTVVELLEKLGQSSDTYLRERTADIHDVSKRVLNHLLERDRTDLSDLNEERVLATPRSHAFRRPFR